MTQSRSSWTSKLFCLCAAPFLVLDVLLYILSWAWLRRLLKPKDMQSVAVGEATDSHGIPRRSAKEPGALVKGEKGTLYETTQAAVKVYASHTAMASRTFVEMKKVKESDRFPSKVFADDLREVSYTELGRNLLDFGAGLRSLGMEPIPTRKDGQTFDDLTGQFAMVIFEDTCEQWTTAMQGAFSQSITVATCYATLGDAAVISAVNETEATTLLLNWKNAEKFAKLAKKMPSLQTIIASTHEMPNGTLTPTPASGSTVKIVSTDEVISMGKREMIQPVPPKPDDIAVIMYTSGSTGKPKGVLMTHSQLVAGIAGMIKNVEVRPGKEVYVSYLPLAHILALQVENALLGIGGKLCYSDPRQLSKALSIFKPTIFAGVPKVWDLLKGGLEKKLAAAPKVEFVFDMLMQWKRLAMRNGLDTPLSNILFKTISKKVFGGIIRFGVSGGGPMSANLHDFCRALFCCPIIQGYALTETCVGGCFQAIDDPRSGVVGPPMPCVEIMLQSEPTIKDGAGLPYMHTDTVGSKGETVIGRGEICFRGPCVSSGYYKLPDKTKEEFIDGWFHSGDIGQFTSDGAVQIVDRKKNLVKLRGGEYVAVEAMETAFIQSPFTTAVCVIASGDLDTPLALVNADNDYLKKWAKENKIAYSGSLEDLVGKEEARAAVVKSMVAAGKEAGLTSLELRIKDCCLIVDDEWGPGSGMTASMKIDRKKILSMHEKELNDMLKRNGVDI